MGYDISIRQKFRKDDLAYSYKLKDSWDWTVTHNGFPVDNGNATSEHSARQAAEQAARLDHARNNAKVIDYEWEPE